MHDSLKGSLDALLQRYDAELQRHGDTALGALWPNEEDRRTRFDVMLDVLDREKAGAVTLCDFACGTGELLAHIQRRGLANVKYIGVDRSSIAISHAREKFPGATFLEIDVTDPNADLRDMACDYLVCSGLFTARLGVPYEEMRAFLSSTIQRLWPMVQRGIAFNVGSSIVDWERDDLFHYPMDDAARLLHELAGRNVRIRADYGLYEYTIYAYKPAQNQRSAGGTILAMRPKLPTTKHLLRYLPRIDKNRIYTNHGPLMGQFQQRMSQRLGLANGTFVAASSGTDAVTGALLAVAGRARPERPLALMPAFTFVATASAAEQCGYRPYLADVAADTWLLDPEKLLAHPALDRVGVVIPVATFGRPVPQAPWAAFHEASGIPVVIDGAASFDLLVDADEQYLGAIPVALSFHATKCFATGEGGGVITTAMDLSPRVTQALNFGFHESRDAGSAGINGKMSEYHAAVGLAELDAWPEKIAGLQRVAQSYRHAFDVREISQYVLTTPDVSSTYVMFNAENSSQTVAVKHVLGGAGIDSRAWYGGGLLRHRYFSKLEHDRLDQTERLSGTLLGLPVASDLHEETIARVASLIASVVRSSA